MGAPGHEYLAQMTRSAAHFGMVRHRISLSQTVITGFNVEVRGCGCLDECEATIDLDTMEIVNIQIGGLSATPYQVEAMMGHDAYEAEVRRIVRKDLAATAQNDARDRAADNWRDDYHS